MTAKHRRPWWPRSWAYPLQSDGGPFLVVTTDDGTNIDFVDANGEITLQHYAFLVSESEFEEIFGRIRERSLPYWAAGIHEDGVPAG